MVGPNGLEPSTSSVSRKRSNQLSYGPARSPYCTGHRAGRQRAPGRRSPHVSPGGEPIRPTQFAAPRFELQNQYVRSDNRYVPNLPMPNASATTAFPRGALVILTLSNPREKFWGAVLALPPKA